MFDDSVSEAKKLEQDRIFLRTWFRQRMSIELQQSLAHAMLARFLRLELSMAFPVAACSTFLSGGTQ